MSGYRSLHRQEVLKDTISIWSVQASPLLKSKAQHLPFDAATWRIWMAASDGLVYSYLVQERSIDSKEQENVLDASALSLNYTHVLLGQAQDYPPVPPVLGCTAVSLTRNYVGDDISAGDLIVASLELAGKVRIWSLRESMDDDLDPSSIGEASPKQFRALHEFDVENATGTTLELCPPRTGGEGNVTIAVGCLDGTIAIVATGLATPKAPREATEAGTLLDTWSSRGSAVPLRLCWHPKHAHVLAVGRQDGVVDILTGTKTSQHRLHHMQPSPVRALSYTNDGNLLIAANDSGMIGVWDVSRKVPSLVHHVLQAHKSWILDLTSIDSRRFVTAGADCKLCVWNVGQLDQPLHTFHLDHSVYTVQKGCEDPPRLVTGSDTGWLQVFSLEK